MVANLVDCFFLLQGAEEGAEAASSSAASKDKEVLQMVAQLQQHRCAQLPDKTSFAPFAWQHNLSRKRPQQHAS